MHSLFASTVSASAISRNTCTPSSPVGERRETEETRQWGNDCIRGCLWCNLCAKRSEVATPTTEDRAEMGGYRERGSEERRVEKGSAKEEGKRKGVEEGEEGFEERALVLGRVWGRKRRAGDGGWLPRYRMRWPLARVVCRGRYRMPDGESSGTLGVHRGACGRSLRDSAHPGTSSFPVEPRSRRARPTSRTAYLPPLFLPHFGCLLSGWAFFLSLLLSLSFRSFFEVRGWVSPPYNDHTDISHFHETCTCLSMVYGKWLSAGGERERERNERGKWSRRLCGWLALFAKSDFLREGR